MGWMLFENLVAVISHTDARSKKWQEAALFGLTSAIRKAQGKEQSKQLIFKEKGVFRWKQ